MSRRALNLCLGAVFVLAAFLHFRNLGGVVYLNEDEARAFTLMTSGPLIWAMGSPVYAFFGRTQAAVFYLAAFLGLCSSWFFYRWCRLWFDGRTALAATLVYAIFPLRINYARTLFPPVFIEFYFMAALWSASVGLLKHSQRRMALSGIFCAAMLFVHVACYSMVFALFCAAVVYGYVERRQIGAAHLWRLFSAMAVGLLGGFLFLEIGFIIVGRGYEYISKSVIMNDYTHLYARYAQTTRRFVPEFLDQWRRLPLWFVIFPSTVAAVILFFMHTFRQKSSRLYFICVLYGVGLGLFLLMAITGVHTIYERHFVWLSSLCAVAVAATLMRLWAAARRPAKKGLVAFAAVLMAAMLWESYAITEETFKITPMRQWIDTQSVTGSQVVTMWWQLNSAGLQAATIVPGGFISKGRVSDKEFWYLDDPRFFIQWSVLHQAFQMGLCRIFITSGTGTRSLVGCKDSVLASVRPAAEWSHPFNYVRRPYFDPDVEPIKAYRLEDIFKPMSRAPDKKL